MRERYLCTVKKSGTADKAFVSLRDEGFLLRYSFMARQQPDQETFMSLSQEGYDSIPIYREKLLDRLTPISLFESFRDCKPVILLESAERGEVWGRFSFLIIDPEEEIRISFKDNLIALWKRNIRNNVFILNQRFPSLVGRLVFKLRCG